ncbi:MAG TPA: hypothetical protein VL463_20280 [Kofleriaceae bacterium]|nr:hypothetical protein [Kofleriaceae bacterium]
MLERIGGAIGDEARALYASWTSLARVGRARKIAEAVFAVRAPSPLGLALVHREWIEAALAGEGVRVRAVIAGASAADPHVRAYLERRVLGRFVAMPRAWERTPETLGAAPPAWIEGAFVRAGLHQLAHAAIDQPRAAIASLASQLGDRAAAFVDAIARARTVGDAALGPRRAAIARSAGAALATDPHALFAIGARAFAPHLAGDAPRQVAQRLPRGLGLRAQAELARERLDPPAWMELILSTS